MTERCIFCEIASKKIPSQIIFEDKEVVAFKDIAPQAPIHIVIIPKKHIPSLMKITDYKAMADIFRAAVKIAEDQGLNESGFRVISNYGPDAGQAVFHLHFHLLGGRKLGWPPG